jgi:site-specific recombinase XerD
MTTSEDYINHLKGTDRASAAVLYGSLLFKFEKWLDSNGDPPLAEITPDVVELYLATLKSQSSVDGSLAAVRGYFKFRTQSLPLGHTGAVIEMQRSNQMSAIKPKRHPRRMKKTSLTPAELKSFLKMLRDKEVSEELYAGIVVLFYFGARSGEFAGLLNKAKVDMKDRSMQIQTEKTRVERYLAWHPKLDTYMKTWYEFVKSSRGLPYPGQWLTKTMKNELGLKAVMVGDAMVTSRTCRHTFETQMRLLGVKDIVIRAVLGHTDHTISDVYTDWTQFVPEIRKAMIEDHYMIRAGAI